MTNPNIKTAIITGPTSGIGLAFAHQLAKNNYRLLLIARQQDKLKNLTQKLRDKYHVHVNYIITDLSKESDLKKTEQEIRKLERVDLLINNAGFGLAGFFMEVGLEEQLKMVNVHLTSTIRFSKAVLPNMIYYKSGAIINVASLSAFLHLPGSVMYATTKAAIIKFSQTLQNEVSEHEIKVQALCPGFTPTAFHQSIKRDVEFVNRIPQFLWTPINQVVESSLSNLNSKKVVCIPGAINKLIKQVNQLPFASEIIHYLASKRQKKQPQYIIQKPYNTDYYSKCAL